MAKYIQRSADDHPRPVPVDRLGQNGRMVISMKTILLVEDDAIISETIGELLSMLGYRVLTANSGADAICLHADVGAEGRCESIELTIMDILMPNMSGLDAIRHITDAAPEAKFILISGLSLNGKEEDEHYASLKLLGYRGFLQKPFTISALAFMVRAALDT